MYIIMTSTDVLSKTSKAKLKMNIKMSDIDQLTRRL